MHFISQVCRTCLRLSSDDVIFHNLSDVDSIVNPVTVKEKLATCVPEMDLESFGTSAICITCFNTLQSAFSFRQMCLHTESKVRQYLSKSSSEVCVNPVIKQESVADEFTKNVDIKIEITEHDIPVRSEPDQYDFMDNTVHLLEIEVPSTIIDCNKHKERLEKAQGSVSSEVLTLQCSDIAMLRSDNNSGSLMSCTYPLITSLLDKNETFETTECLQKDNSNDGFSIDVDVTNEKTSLNSNVLDVDDACERIGSPSNGNDAANKNTVFSSNVLDLNEALKKIGDPSMDIDITNENSMSDVDVLDVEKIDSPLVDITVTTVVDIDVKNENTLSSSNGLDVNGALEKTDSPSIFIDITDDQNIMSSSSVLDVNDALEKTDSPSIGIDITNENTMSSSNILDVNDALEKTDGPSIGIDITNENTISSSSVLSVNDASEKFVGSSIDVDITNENTLSSTNVLVVNNALEKTDSPSIFIDITNENTMSSNNVLDVNDALEKTETPSIGSDITNENTMSSSNVLSANDASEKLVGPSIDIDITNEKSFSHGSVNEAREKIGCPSVDIDVTAENTTPSSSILNVNNDSEKIDYPLIDINVTDGCTTLSIKNDSSEKIECSQKENDGSSVGADVTNENTSHSENEENVNKHTTQTLSDSSMPNLECFVKLSKLDKDVADHHKFKEIDSLNLLTRSGARFNHDHYKTYWCSKCDRSFKSRLGLDLHEGTHSDEFCVTCDKCFKLFKYEHNLYNHQLFDCKVIQKLKKKKSPEKAPINIFDNKANITVTTKPTSITVSADVFENIVQSISSKINDVPTDGQNETSTVSPSMSIAPCASNSNSTDLTNNAASTDSCKVPDLKNNCSSTTAGVGQINNTVRPFHVTADYDPFSSVNIEHNYSSVDRHRFNSECSASSTSSDGNDQNTLRDLANGSSSSVEDSFDANSSSTKNLATSYTMQQPIPTLKLFTCKMCKKTFTCKSYKNFHERFCGELSSTSNICKPCTKCQKMFVERFLYKPNKDQEKRFCIFCMDKNYLESDDETENKEKQSNLLITANKVDGTKLDKNTSLSNVQNTFSCKICYKSFPNIEDKKSHEKRCIPYTVTCWMCFENFKSKLLYESHGCVKSSKISTQKGPNKLKRRNVFVDRTYVKPKRRKFNAKQPRCSKGPKPDYHGQATKRKYNKRNKESNGECKAQRRSMRIGKKTYGIFNTENFEYAENNMENIASDQITENHIVPNSSQDSGKGVISETSTQSKNEAEINHTTGFDSDVRDINLNTEINKYNDKSEEKNLTDISSKKRKRKYNLQNNFCYLCNICNKRVHRKGSLHVHLRCRHNIPRDQLDLTNKNNLNSLYSIIPYKNDTQTGKDNSDTKQTEHTIIRGKKMMKIKIVSQTSADDKQIPRRNKHPKKQCRQAKLLSQYGCRYLTRETVHRIKSKLSFSKLPSSEVIKVKQRLKGKNPNKVQDSSSDERATNTKKQLKYIFEIENNKLMLKNVEDVSVNDNKKVVDGCSKFSKCISVTTDYLDQINTEKIMAVSANSGTEFVENQQKFGVGITPNLLKELEAITPNFTPNLLKELEAITPNLLKELEDSSKFISKQAHSKRNDRNKCNNDISKTISIENDLASNENFLISSTATDTYHHISEDTSDALFYEPIENHENFITTSSSSSNSKKTGIVDLIPVKIVSDSSLASNKYFPTNLTPVNAPSLSKTAGVMDFIPCISGNLVNNKNLPTILKPAESKMTGPVDTVPIKMNPCGNLTSNKNFQTNSVPINASAKSQKSGLVDIIPSGNLASKQNWPTKSAAVNVKFHESVAAKISPMQINPSGNIPNCSASVNESFKPQEIDLIDVTRIKMCLSNKLPKPNNFSTHPTPVNVSSKFQGTGSIGITPTKMIPNCNLAGNKNFSTSSVSTNTSFKSQETSLVDITPIEMSSNENLLSNKNFPTNQAPVTASSKSQGTGSVDVIKIHPSCILASNKYFSTSSKSRQTGTVDITPMKMSSNGNLLSNKNFPTYPSGPVNASSKPQRSGSVDVIPAKMIPNINLASNKNFPTGSATAYTSSKSIKHSTVDFVPLEMISNDKGILFTLCKSNEGVSIAGPLKNNIRQPNSDKLNQQPTELKKKLDNDMKTQLYNSVEMNLQRLFEDDKKPSTYQYTKTKTGTCEVPESTTIESVKKIQINPLYTDAVQTSSLHHKFEIVDGRKKREVESSSLKTNEILETTTNTHDSSKEIRINSSQYSTSQNKTKLALQYLKQLQDDYLKAHPKIYEDVPEVNAYTAPSVNQQLGQGVNRMACKNPYVANYAIPSPMELRTKICNKYPSCICCDTSKVISHKNKLVENGENISFSDGSDDVEFSIEISDDDEAKMCSKKKMKSQNVDTMKKLQKNIDSIMDQLKAVKKYHCRKCPMSFFTKSQLVTHVNEHSNAFNLTDENTR